MSWFKKDDSSEARPECPRSESGQHLWEKWHDTTLTKTWEECEACYAKRND